MDSRPAGIGYKARVNTSQCVGSRLLARVKLFTRARRTVSVLKATELSSVTCDEGFNPSSSAAASLLAISDIVQRGLSGRAIEATAISATIKCWRLQYFHD